MPKKKDGVKQYLEQVREFRLKSNIKLPDEYEYWGMEDFVLKNGVYCTPTPLLKGLKRGPMKECYRNALLLLIQGPDDWTYVEGYAADGQVGFPTLHAWLITKDYKVIDPTWRYHSDSEYFGVPMDFKYVLDQCLKLGRAGMLDDWERGWPLLKKGNDKWKVKKEVKS